MSHHTTALLEIDGANVHPHTVDPRVAADLVKTFFDLLAKAARARGIPLVLQGIRIEDKCFLVGCDTTEPELTIQAFEVVSGWVEGTEPFDSKQDAGLVRHFSTLLRTLGGNVTVKMAVGRWERQLGSTGELPSLPPQATTTQRVKVLEVGVEPARVRFSSGSEDEPFSLVTTVEQAEQLGRFINQELDLVFTYRRDRFGHIAGGRILEFFPMESDDQGEDWLRWLTENGRHWNDVDDLEELGRRDD